MNNHNPITLAIASLQEKWQTETSDNDYQLIRWLIKKEDLKIFNGFLHVEATSQGALEETFLILFTPFVEAHSYAYNLAKDLLALFEQELPVWDDYTRFQEQWELLSPEKHHEEENTYLLAAILQSFKKYRSEHSKLVFGLLPYAVTNERQYVDWVDKMLPLLPEDVALMVVDDPRNEKFQRLFNKQEKERITIHATDCFNTEDVYKQLATAGNPDDPQVAFRQCVFAMGEAAQKGNKQRVYDWGEKALACTQGSGDKLLWASAHVVYAGFLFGFKSTEKINKLLDGGMNILYPLLDAEETQVAASGLLGQFYGYKAAYLNMDGDHEASILWFEKQADLFVQYKQEILSIGAFQNALFVASKHNRAKVGEIAEKAFPIGYAQEDESLGGSGFAVIAYHYLQICDEKEKKGIDDRMQHLFGEDWKTSAKKNFASAPEEYVL